ncbi:hypothetical protein BZG36_04800 [Bifiguratus adelaidae]|uniref:Vacuolar calcium ion transporter n=1 Tax=Bifiguratus adelaidae TaxID=1938954 RepID=A0A261XUW6_9FUNG|nr:hypothetical protein BZG36_04800 [Bifiguratus adelaidae]
MESQPLLSSRDTHSIVIADLHGVKNILVGSYLNVLLLFIPFALASESLHWSDSVIFTLNFIAIIPLAKLLGTATEELALRSGSVVGALLNATFGNAIELILGIIALRAGLIRVVQASIIGSILSNLLLVLGCCFLAGGLSRYEQSFNVTAAQTSSSLLALTTLSIIIPAAFVKGFPQNDVNHALLDLSHGVAIILLIVYALSLLFQLRTHSDLYEDVDDHEEEPTISLAAAVVMLIVVTLLVAWHAEYLVGSIEGIVTQWHLSETFVGVILLPIVGNAAEHVSSVTFAMKNKMELCVGIAIGSSTQVGLFLTPFLVITGWMIGQPMTLYFETFETALLFASVLIVNYLIQDGKSNWLEGTMLLSVYAMIAVAFYNAPIPGDGF